MDILLNSFVGPEGCNIGDWEGRWEGEANTEKGHVEWVLKNKGYGTPRLIGQHHGLKNHPFDDFTDISGTTCPNSASDPPWLTQPWGSIPLIDSSHWSSHLSIYILFFPWWVTVFHFITHFLSDVSSDLSYCSEMELSVIFLWLIVEQSLTDPRNIA